MIDEALSAGAVARRLGVAVTTLRTWHQRYGLGPSHHVPGQHRRYTAEDLDRLEVMLRLTAQGVSPAEAAAWARRTPVPARGGPGNAGTRSLPPTDVPASGGPGIPPSPAEPGVSEPSSEHHPSPPLGGRETSRPPHARLDDEAGASRTPRGRDASRPHDEAGAWEASGESGTSGSFGPAADWAWPPAGARDGGGQAIALGQAVPAARGLARAAMRLDVATMRDILEMVVADHGVVTAWTDVAAPVLIGVGDRYEATQRFVEVEHLLSRCVTEVMSAVPRPAGAGPPRVLLAAADEEQHTLALEALAAGLAEAGVPARLLGGRVPPRALTDAIARTGPEVVVLWSQTPATGDPTQLSRLAGPPRPPLLLAAAGPGWPASLPSSVTRLGTLADAVTLVRSATT